MYVERGQILMCPKPHSKFQQKQNLSEVYWEIKKKN